MENLRARNEQLQSEVADVKRKEAEVSDREKHDHDCDGIHLDGSSYDKK